MSKDPGDSRQFRKALGCFATGVTAITTKIEGEAAIGITANSFSSVSLDPPLVLWCLDNGSDTFSTFERCDSFAINVLRAEQRDLSDRLARQGEHGLEGVPIRDGVNGVPVLAEALAVFDCTVEARYDGGDHTILVGRVSRFSHAEEGEPLIYARGGYNKLAG